MAGTADARDEAPTRGARVLTGLATAAMGVLVWLASLGHVWAWDIAVAAGPLLILAAGILAAIILTDRDEAPGRYAIAAGLALLFAASLGIVPEAIFATLAPWALVALGTVIALSGPGLLSRSATERTAAARSGTTRGDGQRLHRPFGQGASGCYRV
jgi:hypothetical protein